MDTLNTFYDDYIGLVEFVQQHRSMLFGSEKRTILVQVFSGQCEQAFLARLSAEIRALIPHASIIGTTTSGEIMNGQVTGLKTVLSFSIFNHTAIKSGFFPKDGQDDFELGRRIVAELGSDKGKILILFATGLSVNAKNMLLGIQSLYPRLPVAGGNAGNNSLTEQSFLVCDGQVIDSGAVGVLLEGEDLTVNCYSHLGWQPIGKEMIITKAKGLRVYTIDHMPTYEIYRKYLGLDEIRNFFNVIEYPLIATRHGVQIARTPDIHYEDDSIGFAAELIEGEKVRFSFGHIGMISEKIASLCQTIKQQPAESIYVYSCECRRGFLQDLSTIETQPLQEIAPTAGFFTHGEFFHANGTHQLLNAMMTVLVLSESVGKTRSEKPMASLPYKDTNKNCKSYKDNVAERNTGVLKALTHLVNTVTAELVDTNEKLRHVSLHDSLTGLYNRTFFQEKMDSLENTDQQVGVIVCDLDFLKIINDVLGHAAGDKVLRLASDVLARSCSKEDVVARIGGDEFTILVTNGNLPLLMDIRNRILTEAANQRILNHDKLVYLSVGFALKGEGGAKSMEDAFKMADAEMYHHKLAGKREIRQEVIRNLIKITGAYPHSKKCLANKDILC